MSGAPALVTRAAFATEGAASPAPTAWLMASVENSVAAVTANVFLLLISIPFLLRLDLFYVPRRQHRTQVLSALQGYAGARQRLLDGDQVCRPWCLPSCRRG